MLEWWNGHCEGEGVGRTPGEGDGPLGSLEAWKRPSRSTRGTSHFAGPLEAAAEAAEAATASESRMQASFAEMRAELAEAERTLTTEARDVQVQDSGGSSKLLSLVCSRSSTRLH